VPDASDGFSKTWRACEKAKPGLEAIHDRVPHGRPSVQGCVNGWFSARLGWLGASRVASDVVVGLAPGERGATTDALSAHGAAGATTAPARWGGRLGVAAIGRKRLLGLSAGLVAVALAVLALGTGFVTSSSGTSSSGDFDVNAQQTECPPSSAAANTSDETPGEGPVCIEFSGPDAAAAKETMSEDGIPLGALDDICAAVPANIASKHDSCELAQDWAASH